MSNEKTEVEIESKETLKLLNKYQEVKELADNAKEAMDVIKKKLIERVGDHDYGTYKGERVVTRVVTQPSFTVDAKKLKEEFPEIFAQVLKEKKGSTSYRINWV